MSIALRFSIKPIIISIFVFILLAIFIRQQLYSIPPLPIDAANSVFSAERAFVKLQQLNPENSPHPVDSHANRLFEKRLIEQLHQLGYQEEIQQTEYCQDNNFGRAACTQIRNIIVTIDGYAAETGILLSAHYDSVAAGPGGSDAGAAVGSLLEIARLLTLQPQPRNRIVLLFNEGEEFGLLGAKAFMQHPSAKDLQVVMNIEARGSSGQSVMFETGENSGWLVKQYAQTTPAPLSSSLFYEVYRYLPNDTDLTVYKEYGLQGLNFAHAEREPHYHTPLDNLSNLDKGSLQHHGDNVWGVLKNIKDLDLSKQVRGNLIYTDILGLVMLEWQEANSLIISFILLFGLLIAYYRINSRFKLSVKNVIGGMLGFIATVFVCMLSGWLVQHAVLLLGSSNEPWRANNLPMQIAVWSAGLLFTLFLLRAMFRRSNPLSLLVALVLCWILLAISSSLQMPGISFLFILPAAVGVLGLLFTPWIVNRFPRSGLTSILIIVATGAAIIFLPIVYVLEIMVSYPLVIALSLMLGLAISSLMPMFTFDANFAHTHIRKTVLTAFNKLTLAVFATVLFGIFWTSEQAPFTADMPQEQNLQYLQTADNKAALIAGEHDAIISTSLAEALGTLNRGKIIPWRSRDYIYSEINSLAVQGAELIVNNLDSSETLVTDKPQANSKDINTRKVNISINSHTSSLSDILLYIPVDSGLTKIMAGEHTLTYANEKNYRNNFYEYRCRGESCKNLKLTLHFDNLQKTQVKLVNVTQNLPASYLSLLQKRGAESTPRQDGDQTLVVTEYQL